jgi:hypothetical protein
VVGDKHVNAGPVLSRVHSIPDAVTMHRDLPLRNQLLTRLLSGVDFGLGARYVLERVYSDVIRSDVCSPRNYHAVAFSLVPVRFL